MVRKFRSAMVIAMVLVSIDFLVGHEERRSKPEQKAVDWVAKVEMEPVGDLQARAIRFRQTVSRKGPTDKEAQILFEETTTGRVRIKLREDGLLLIQPVASAPAVVFPVEKGRVELALPTPKGVDPNAFSRHMEETWFLDDGIFYHRFLYPNRLVFGFIRLDAAKKGVAESKICLEISDTGKGSTRAAKPLAVVFKMGDFVFWVNTGYHNVWYPDDVKGLWKPRKVRVLNLTTANLVEIEKVPAEFIKSHIDRILDFVEKQAHNQSPELECWAVKEIGKYGGPREAARLKVLAGTIQETTSEVAPFELRATDKVVKTAYTKALEMIEKNKAK